jgi:hypothetical protein
MVGGVAGSPVKTSSAVLNDGRCKLNSIHFCSTGTATLKIYDHNSTTVGSADEIARLILTANNTIEFDMHGRTMGTGVTAILSGTGGTYACTWS